MKLSALVTLASFLVAQIAAHGGVSQYIINGVTYQGWSPYNSPTGQSSIERPYSSYDPILSPTASTISCNNNGQAGGGQLSATVAAGTAITAKWAQWTHAQGPVMVYMAKCSGSCTSNNSNNLSWFKIAHTDLVSGELVKSRTPFHIPPPSLRRSQLVNTSSGTNSSHFTKPTPPSSTLSVASSSSLVVEERPPAAATLLSSLVLTPCLTLASTSTSTPPRRQPPQLTRFPDPLSGTVSKWPRFDGILGLCFILM